MWTVKMRFWKEKSLLSDEEQELIESFVYTLPKSGQSWGDFVLSLRPQQCLLFLSCPERDSHTAKWDSKYVTKEREKLEASAIQSEWEILEEEGQLVIPDWKDSTSLYLFTHMFDETSPVCDGDTGRPLPLYHLPLNEIQREQLVFWMQSYRDHDRVFLDSGTLEIPAYEEMLNADSLMSERGRSLAKEVEAATGKPVYYYLMRYWGFIEEEDRRVCPDCGGPWRVEELPERPRFHQFPFRCEPCRLVSSDASSFDNDNYARLGTWEQKQKGKQRDRNS